MSTEYYATGPLEKHEEELGLPQDWTSYQLAHSSSSGVKLFVPMERLRPLLERYADEVCVGPEYRAMTGRQAIEFFERATEVTPEETNRQGLDALRRYGWLP